MPGVAPVHLDRAKFDAAIASAPKLRASGTLYDTYETYTMIARFGGRGGLYLFAEAACAGLVHPDIIDMLTCLRAVAHYKDEECTAIRPLGIGEGLQRIIGRCFAAQKRSKWASFFTEPLAEDVALNQTKMNQTAAAATAAQTAYEAAVMAGSPDAVSLHSCLSTALTAQYQATITPRYPVNYASSPRGTELTVHTVQNWFESAPQQPKLSDDKKAMYNSVARTAMFTALRERPECHSYIALYRTLYGRPARIFLARGDGEFTVPRVWLADLDDEDAPPDADPAAAADAAADAFVPITGNPTLDDPAIFCAIRSACGVAQGCPIATFGACLPLHLSFHRLQKLFPNLGIVCLANDAYYTAPADILYEAFARVRLEQLRDLNLHSNMGKVKAINPLGGTDSIPAEILHAKGGEIVGFKCVARLTLNRLYSSE
jgi:hypothetical protein